MGQVRYFIGSFSLQWEENGWKIKGFKRFTIVSKVEQLAKNVIKTKKSTDINLYQH